jgi:hypothetical protein
VAITQAESVWRASLAGGVDVKKLASFANSIGSYQRLEGKRGGQGEGKEELAERRRIEGKKVGRRVKDGRYKKRRSRR